MTSHGELLQFGVDEGYEDELYARLDPFVIDDDYLAVPDRAVRGRMHWRYEVLATARRMLADGGYENFTMKALAQKTGSSPQTIFNNLGRKDDVLTQAIMQCKQRWLDSPIIAGSNLHTCGKAFLSRYLMTVHYPDFSKAIVQSIDQSSHVRETMESDFRRRIYVSLAPRARADDRARVFSFLMSMLTDVARVTGYDWFSGRTSAYEMLRNSIDGANWCLAGSDGGDRPLPIGHA